MQAGVQNSMQVATGSECVGERARGCVLTIGNFDGVHLGHQALVSGVVDRARKLGVHAAVYTFDPHPKRVLQPQHPHPQITLWSQLEYELERLGIGLLIREPFTRELAALEPEDFVARLLHQRLGPAEIWVGRDFRFGHDRNGSDETLRRLAREHGMQVRVVSQVLEAGEDVSSTRVRGLIELGRIGEVARCLGRLYTIWGSVVPGDGRGRTLGFPTANITPENDLVPGIGVYATTIQRVENDRPTGPLLPCVTNIGTRPTFGGSSTRVETHVLDFDGDLYGQRLALGFAARLRGEQRFAGPDALRAQLVEDVKRARPLLVAQTAGS